VLRVQALASARHGELRSMASHNTIRALFTAGPAALANPGMLGGSARPA